jgi:hypothetical protein
MGIMGIPHFMEIVYNGNFPKRNHPANLGIPPFMEPKDMFSHEVVQVSWWTMMSLF